MTFSTRTSHAHDRNALARVLDGVRASGRPWLDLTESNPTRAGIRYDSSAILAALSDPRSMVYAPEPFGIPSAREAVAHEIGVRTSQVMLTASTSEAYAFLFKLLCDPGDEVLVPQPSYPLFELLARFEAVKLVPYRLAYDGEWHVDLDSVRRAVGARTRGLLVVSPNNPTGSFTKRTELEALAGLGLPIVSDEVFAAYPFAPDARRAPTALDARDVLVFALGGLSKLAALPQMKLAWVTVGGPEPIVSEALARLEIIQDSFLSVSTPIQHAVPALLASRGPAEEAIRHRTRANLAALDRLLGTSSAASILRVEGGWYATLRLPRTRSDEDWAIHLLEDDGVYVHPGHFFDFEDEGCVVVSLLTETATFVEGARRLAARVDGA